MFCRSWKCWHAPMNHAKALAVTTACDMHLECSEGKLNNDWKVTPVNFHRFREKLGMQMMRYDPRHRLHFGDERFRVCAQQNKSQRRRTSPCRASSSSSESVQSTSSGVDGETLSSITASSTRLCGFLDNLIKHSESIKRYPGHNQRVCVVCGKQTAKHCSKCDKAMHLNPPDGSDTNASCFMLWHDTGFFGLARDDCRIVQKRQRDWSFPSQEQRTLNTKEMKQVHKEAASRENNSAINADNGTPSSSNNNE